MKMSVIHSRWSCLSLMSGSETCCLFLINLFFKGPPTSMFFFVKKQTIIIWPYVTLI